MDRGSSTGQSRLKVKSLIVMVGLAALGFGFLAQTARTIRDFDESQARFQSWMVEVEKANPSLQRAGTSFKTSTSLLEMSRTNLFTLATPTRKFITIQARFRSGPFSSRREVTFDTNGRSVTWPFDDIQANRMIDLKAEFPDAFR